MVKLITNMEDEKFTSIAKGLRTDLVNDKIEDFLHKLSALFKTIPYTVHVKDEKYFQSLFFVTIKLIGGEVYVE